jgi:hypothetical protein
MVATVDGQLRWANRRRTELVAYPAYIRLACLLMDMADSVGRPTNEVSRSWSR